MTNEKKITIAVGIPTYNRGETLIHTITEVLRQDPGPDEVLVVDQSDERIEAIATKLESLAQSGAIRYIRQTEPSLPAARNRALRETRCDVIVFIDDDVILTPGFIAAHRKNYTLDSTVWAVAGRVEQRLGWPAVKRPDSWPRILDYRYLKLDGEDRLEGVASFIGCNHSMRVPSALRIGGV